MFTFAAPAAAPSGGFAILGTVGFTGGALVMTVVLVLGIRGNGKIKFNHTSAVVMGFITGQLYAMAGQFGAFAGDMSKGLSQAIQQGVGQGGTIGAGAIALIMCALMYGTKLKRTPGVVLGILSPPIFTAAGGGFAIVTTLLSSALTTVVG
ncbi:hypothetical protein [Streptomyces sp. MJM1172]|uniref:hypothetical protein n=1 Tax=Streptomyces sp. MJM1172 TaxID=1703926 RepID=UPI000B08AE97|nr:hypothetical protein [Streptomyces sp. MJM1172]